MLIIVMLLGAGAVYMVLRKIYAALWYKNLTVRIDFSKKNAVCGETIELIETVTNKKRLPLPYINLKFQVNRAFRFEDGEENSVVSDNTYRNDIFSLMMYQKVTRKIPIKCTKRVYLFNWACRYGFIGAVYERYQSRWNKPEC